MDELREKRNRMVEEQIAARGVRDARILEAMRRVARHEFVPADEQDKAYEDHPIPIGKGQTISQPYIVAYMTEALALRGAEKVLEIGTGSGYQAAVLSLICREVHTVEIVEVLHRRARRTLDSLGYDNIHCVFGDGSLGDPEHAPFDRIMLTAATPKIPDELIEQLSDSGLLLYPEGKPFGYQELVVLRASKGKYSRTTLTPVRFVPMTGKASRE